MKKVLALITILSLALCLFAGCGEKNEPAVNVKIGLAAPNATHGWVAGVAYNAEKFCNEKGIEYKFTSSADAAEMSNNINSLVEWGAQALVVWPQWSGMEDTVKKVVAQGIPVVGFDVDIACDGVYKVTGDNYDMGYRSAEYILGKVGDGATIAVLTVPSSGSVSERRKAGFMDYLNEKSYDTSNVFTVEEASFSRDAGYSDTMKILAEHEHIDAIFSMDDEVSIGIVKAITETGRTDVKAITGGGGMQEYFKMISSADYASLGLASALYSPSMINDAINTAISLGSGNSASKITVIPTTIVTAENVSEYLDSRNMVY